VRQINAILARLERDLATRGLDVSRHGVGGIHFRVPPPWRTRSAGLLGAATSGRVRVTAGRGERRQVRYELKFTTLQAVLTLASFTLVIVGWQRARVSLVGSVVLIWLLLYLPAYFIATRQLRAIVATGAREVIDRRRAPRPTPDTADPGTATTATVRSMPPASPEQGGTS
jgi:hypothetical protein